MADGDSPSYSHYLILSGGAVVIVCSCRPFCVVLLSLRLVKVREPSSGRGLPCLNKPNSSLQSTYFLGHPKGVKGCFLSC